LIKQELAACARLLDGGWQKPLTKYDGAELIAMFGRINAMSLESAASFVGPVSGDVVE
jgi:hypothetical protein